jgi:molybdopterin synthase catalytic subunit
MHNAAMGEIRLCEISDQPLDLTALQQLVADDRAGALVSFSGNVRDHDHGRPVTSLSYEGHPSAADVLAEVVREIDAQFEVISIGVAHRIGALKIGDPALIAVVATAHRAEAFRACAALVDLVKERLPVWKHQVFADGTDEWVNCA